jgi:hypothetical protein
MFYENGCEAEGDNLAFIHATMMSLRLDLSQPVK